MIGLRRGVVEVVPYRDAWPHLFAAERSRLVEALGAIALRIEHVGSTAVPGLAAKPILDIALAVASLADVAPCRVALGAIGFLDRGDQGDDGGWLLVKEREPDVRSVHLHIVAIDDPQWCRYLSFRDRLRENPALRHDYQRLKNALRARYPSDRPAYTAGKNLFIRSVLDVDACGAPGNRQ